MMSSKKTIVIIPAYEPPREFIEYAKQVSKKARKLVVVNDGSSREYDFIFEEIAAMENVEYISYRENHGKGYALKQALKYCVENFDQDDVCITADCDGQHAVDDIEAISDAAHLHSDTLILGSRNFDLPTVPKRSRMGNTNIRRLFRFIYGLNISDTQTGLRGFSVKLAKQFLSIRGDRFEYEMDMLIYAQKNGIPISEVPIRTIYPDDPREHVSHFKTVKDSARVVGVTLKNLNWYMLSSALSGILDVIVFFLLSNVILGKTSALNTLIATVGARMISSVLNLTLNKKFVFGGKSRRSIYRYYILWACQLSASYGLVFLFGNVIGLPMTPMKAAGDILLGIIGYRLQRCWVFKNDDTQKFYGPLVTSVRFFAKVFTKRYKCKVQAPCEPTVYVCRHLNMHGPMTTLIRLNFHVHPMVLNVFFDKEKCYKQYSEYTFTKRKGKQKKKHYPFIYVASRVVPVLVRSIKAIPVYRGKNENSLQTLKISMEYLNRGESVIVYPDIDYTAGYETESELYDGFLLLGQMYKRATGKSLRFVPLYIDEKARTIREACPVTVDCFRKERSEAYEYIKSGINGNL